MSKQDKIAKLKEYIKNYVIKELEKDDEIEEVSTTASAGAANPMGTGIYYDTPKAFSSGSAVGHKSPEVGGYKKVNEVTDKEITSLQKLYKGAYDLRKGYIKITSMGDKELKDKKYNKNYEAILKLETVLMNLIRELTNKKRLGEGLNEGRYHDWRNDESITPKQKIGRSMREVRDSLNGLSKTIDMSVKLKTELKVDSKDYWKTTNKALTKISERLVKLANKVGRLQ